MPTYEYVCAACGHEFEAFHAISAAPISLCPKCKKKKVKRKISKGGGLIFKGSGFYLTDYARGKPDASAPAAASEAKPKIGSEPAAGKVHAAKRELEAATKAAEKPAESKPAKNKK